MMRSLLWICGILCIFFVDEVTLESEHDAQARCDILFDGAVVVRDDIFRNPISQEMADGLLEHYETQIKSILSMSSFEDSEIRRVACQIANFTTMKDLADLFGVSEKEARYSLEQLNSSLEEIITAIEKYKKELKIVQKWIEDTSFPDEWPLNTTKKSIKHLLKKAHGTTIQLLLAHFGWGKDDKEIIRILIKSQSFKEFAENLGQDPESIKDNFDMTRRLQDKKVMKQMFAAMDAYVTGLKAINNSGLSTLP